MTIWKNEWFRLEKVEAFSSLFSAKMIHFYAEKVGQMTEKNKNSRGDFFILGRV